MSETQSYKTFTFTPEEVVALSAVALGASVLMFKKAALCLLEGNEKLADDSMDSAELLLAAHDKLVRK